MKMRRQNRPTETEPEIRGLVPWFATPDQTARRKEQDRRCPAIATAFASPVFAQSYDASVGSGNIVSSPYRSNPTVPAHHAYAHSPRAVQSPRAYTTARGWRIAD